ncbi:hypothetical protein HZC08_00630 [Candidatus Micrarchaeota archaeon]|nr:hypothetical protein [Candidatus Micrarchaeota archaeon]
MQICLIFLTLANLGYHSLYKLGVPPLKRFVVGEERTLFMRYKDRCEEDSRLASRLGGTDISLVDEILCAEALTRWHLNERESVAVFDK